MRIDDRRMVLQRQRHAGVCGVAGALGERFTAPLPHAIARESLARFGLYLTRGVVPANAVLDRDPRPRGEYAHNRSAEIRGHSNQIADIGDLGFAMLRNRAAEIVIRRDSINLDAFTGGKGAKLAAAFARPVQRIPVGALAVDLDAVVAIFARAGKEALERKRFAAVPQSGIRNAVQSDLYVRPRSFYAAQRRIAYREGAGRISCSMNV